METPPGPVPGTAGIAINSTVSRSVPKTSIIVACRRSPSKATTQPLQTKNPLPAYSMKAEPPSSRSIALCVALTGCIIRRLKLRPLYEGLTRNCVAANRSPTRGEANQSTTMGQIPLEPVDEVGRS
jgi:hypothetical protein